MISILFQVSILQAAETRLALRSWQLEQQDKAAAPTLCVQGCGHSNRADAIEHHEVRGRLLFACFILITNIYARLLLG